MFIETYNVFADFIQLFWIRMMFNYDEYIKLYNSNNAREALDRFASPNIVVESGETKLDGRDAVLQHLNNVCNTLEGINYRYF